MHELGESGGPLFIVASGTNGPDVFNGGSGADTYTGLDGRDTIRGGDGNDSLNGGADDDNIDGQNGDDTLAGDLGNDFLQGSAGNDSIDGGAGGFDTAGYNGATSGVSVDLRISGPQAVGGGLGVDVLANVERLQGSSFNDTLIGNNEHNGLEGLQGDDILDGLGGEDDVEYGGASSGVTVNLNVTTPQNVGGGQGIDTLRNIENIGASFFADTLTGNASNNYFTGRGGGDRISGNGGYDTVSYRGLPGGVIANLALGGGNAITPTGTDTLTSIESLGGSNFNDTLTGDANNNNLSGREGDDRLDGGAGFDSADYYEATGAVKVDLAIAGPQNVGVDGIDTLISIENINGSFFADTLSGDANNNSFALRGLNGDVVDGRGGFDRVSYYEATDGGVSANLMLGTAVHAVGTDTLTSIEAVTGTSFADTLIGGSENNTFSGSGGDDSIDGGAGQDGLDFYSATGGVTVNLNLTTAQVVGGGEGTDTLLNFEQIFASFYGDTLTGTAGDNYFNTRGGGDRIDGGGGFDTVDYADLTAGVIVNLSTGSAITITGNDTLTSIERVNGTEFADTITGDANNNGFFVRSGDDRVDGGGGTDSLDFFSATAGFRLDLSNGGPQDLLNGHGVKTVLNVEQIFGSFFADTMTGTAASNYFSTRGGGDRIDGGAGFDTVDFFDVSGGVNASLVTGASITPTGNDTLIGIEALNGSRFNDTLVGDAGNNNFQGRTGDDLIDGGAGVDFVNFGDATGGITVDLNLTTAQNIGGGLGLDTLLNIENLSATIWADTLTGTASNNNFSNTRGGGDRIDGGAGFDNVDYRDLLSGFSANLGASGGNVVSGAGTDTLIGIEGLTGSAFSDTFVGDASSNTFSGRQGDDVMDGGAGVDSVDYIDATAGVTVSLAVTTAQVVGGDQGVDTIVNFENINGSAFADTLTGDAGNNNLIGRGGDDRLDGGAGIDTVNYGPANGSVTVNLSIAGAQAASADQGADTLLNIENVTGGAFNDTLTGDAAGNLLNGNAGNDSLSGVGGNDNLIGGIGNDIAQGGDGSDVLQGQAGNDTLMGGADGDQLLGGADDDLLDGGDGFDLAVYSIATGGVKVSLAISGAQTVGADQGADTLVNIEQLFGSNFNDTLIGNGGNNYLGGSLGDDSLVGGGGQDFLAGGAGNDILDGSSTDEVLPSRNTVGGDYGYYDDATGGVTVDLSIAGGQAVGGGLGVDTLISIENLRGSTFADVLKGDGGINYLLGLAGNDTLQGAGGDDVLEGNLGDDLMDGGDGVDLVSYFGNATGGVTVDLGAAGGQDVGGGLGIDTLVSIEWLYGSAFGDRVIGTGDANYVDAQAGDDTVTAGGGSDTLLGAAGNDVLGGEGGDDTLSGEAGNDSVAGGAGFDVATFSGARGDYAITQLASGDVSVVDLRAGGADGADTLSGVEAARFTDGDVSLEASVLSISATPVNLAEGVSGTTAFTFTVTRGGGTIGSTTATWTVAGSGAHPASAADFAGGVLPSGTITFAPGETSRTLTVNVAGDTLFEPDEGFTVTLTAPTGGASIASAVGTATILNDDTDTPPTAAPDSASVNEDATVVIDVLANDTDPDLGDVKTLVSVTGTARGASVSIVDNKVVYVADADSFDLLKTGNSDLDSFSYTVRDASGATSTATVQVTVNGVADGAPVTGGGGNDSFGGTATDERIDGGAGNDTIGGGEGADVLIGGAGNDNVDGGTGIDSLSAGDGGDSLNGGAGDDVMAGGRGADLFVFHGHFGHDTVIDFKPGEDDIRFEGAGVTSFADVIGHAAQVGTNVLIDLGGGDSVQLNNVSLASLSSGDFLFA